MTKNSGVSAKYFGGGFRPAIFLAAGLAAFCAGCAGAPPVDDSALATGAKPVGYALGSGDKLHVTVYGDQSLTGDYTVDDQGNVAFPLIGSVHAGGETTNSLASNLSHKLSPEYIKDPHVTVAATNYRPFYILGEVKNPGSYPYVTGMTVLDAVAIAGGYTYRAKESQAKVSRPAATSTNTDQFNVTVNARIAPGDVITVPERYF